MSFGENVRWLRKRVGITQAALAAQVRVNHHRPTASYISRVESGEIDPRLVTVRGMAKALGVKPWQLVAEISENTAFWGNYLDLSPVQKRNVQQHIDWLQRGHR